MKSFSRRTSTLILCGLMMTLGLYDFFFPFFSAWNIRRDVLYMVVALIAMVAALIAFPGKKED